MAIDDDYSADDAPEDQLLARAAAVLRESTDHGWIRVRSSVLDRARWALRPSIAVAGVLTPEGPGSTPVTFSVQSTVVVSVVRAALDRLPTVRPDRIVCQAERDGTITNLTVMVSAAYGEQIIELAQTVRSVCAATVRALLGLPDLPESVVTVDICVTDVFTLPPAANH